MRQLNQCIDDGFGLLDNLEVIISLTEYTGTRAFTRVEVTRGVHGSLRQADGLWVL